MVFFLFKIIVIGLAFLLISPLFALMFVFKIIALIAKGIREYGKRKWEQSGVAESIRRATEEAVTKSDSRRVHQKVRKHNQTVTTKAHGPRKADENQSDNDSNKPETIRV